MKSLSRLLFILCPFAISLFTLKTLGHPCEINYINLLTYDGVEESIKKEDSPSEKIPNIILPSWEDGTIFFPVKLKDNSNSSCKSTDQVVCVGTELFSLFTPNLYCFQIQEIDIAPSMDA